MAATVRDPRTFFTRGTVAQYEYIHSLYDVALRLKAEQKNKSPEEFIKLDNWYQQELPKKIASRGKETHLTHEELCKCMKWKLARGKFSPRLKDLIQMNTPRLCLTETKKAFRALNKKDDLPSAVQALCNLKGVGPAMASAILTAANPEVCGFMADECLMAIPEIESIDYTTKELLNFVDQLKCATDRLNKEAGSKDWNPHKVELALWAHSVVSELKKELLDDMPGGLTPAPLPVTENGSTSNDQNSPNKNGTTTMEESNDSTDSYGANKENMVNTNGTAGSRPESKREDSDIPPSEDTSDSLPVSEPEPLSEPHSESCDASSPSEPSENSKSALPSAEDSSGEPSPKKMKVAE